MNKNDCIQIFSEILDEYEIKIDLPILSDIAIKFMDAIEVNKEMECEQHIDCNKKSNFEIMSDLKRELEKTKLELDYQNRFNAAVNRFFKRKYNTAYVSINNNDELVFA